MRLFVVDKNCHKIYLNVVSETRSQLTEYIGSQLFTVRFPGLAGVIENSLLAAIGQQEFYNVKDVESESYREGNWVSGMIAGALVFGMIGGLIAGFVGVIVGAIIGAIIGKKSDVDEQRRVDKFNSSI